MTTPATFQTRVSFDHVRNTAAGFTSANPVLGYGVIGLETDSGKIKVGDGATSWSSLPYSGGGPVEWSAITGKPSTFAPATHTHTKGEVGLGNVDNTSDASKPVSTAQAAADAAVASAAAADATSKANAAQAAAVQRANHTGTQAISTVSGLQAALDSKATPADVTTAVANVVGAAPAALDTLNELAAALGNDASFATTVTNALAAKAPLASPTFTGTVSGITQGMVGLGSVDNTSDASKPISTATQTALDSKASATDSRFTDAREWTASTVSQADAEAGSSTTRVAFTPLRVFQAVAAWWAASAAKTKLDGIAAGATANATDAQLRDRSTHTGTQAISTVSGLQTALDGKQASGAYLTAVPDGSVTDAKIDAAGLSASSINWAAVTAWAANTSYAKGALVHYLGITYRRATAGTSGSQFSAANWVQITAPVNVTTTPSQITSNQNDYALAITTNDVFRISSDAARNITGITAGLFDGHAILLRNVGSFAITLKHQDTGSTAANRIISPWAGDVVISASSSMLLMYDNTLSRWVVT